MKYIWISLLSIFLIGCSTYVTEPVLDSPNQNYEISFDFESPHSIKLEDNTSYIGFIATVVNMGKTSINVNEPAYLIDLEGYQYDVDYKATQALIRDKKDNKLKSAIYGYSLQPKIPVKLIWGFHVPEGRFKFYHKVGDNEMILSPKDKELKD